MRVRRAVVALLELFDEQPDLARLLLLDSPDRDAWASRRRAELIGEIAASVWDGAPEPAIESAFDAASVVGAGISMIQRRLRSRSDAPLVELVNPLMAMLVLPRCGRAGSARELAEAGVSICGLRPAA